MVDYKYEIWKSLNILINSRHSPASWSIAISNGQLVKYQIVEEASPGLQPRIRGPEWYFIFAIGANFLDKLHICV